nr:hypothetical protein [Tanacetum cinerariifolium]
MIAWLRKKSEKERATPKTPTPLHTLKNKEIHHCWSEDTTDVDNLGPSKDDEGIEWSDVDEPLDLVDTSLRKKYRLSLKYDILPRDK